jgi:HYR domain
MNARPTVGIAAFALVLTLVADVAGTPRRLAGALQLDATISSVHRSDPGYCPAGTPAIATCVRYVGVATIPGLGRVTSTYTKIAPGDGGDCDIVMPNTVVIDVAGKGSFELARVGRVCNRLTVPYPPIGPLEFTVARGSGTYAGASGSLTFRSIVFSPPSVTSRDSWTGTLAVPGLDFDVTPPTLAGAVSRTVVAPKGARRIRVRYVVRAKDAADSAPRVVCTPPSGAFFRLGRTTVTCSATDSSGNSGRARFGITVRPRR